MNKFKLMLALLGAPCMVLASCGDTPAPVVEKKVNKVTVSCSAKEVMVSKSIKASVTVAGENLDAEDKKVEWKSSNESVATVDSTGKIVGVKAGKATITATSKYDSSKSDSVEITVIDLGWSSADKAMMQEYLGIVVPYFEGSFTWTDEYYAEYECLTAESSKSADLEKAIDGFEKAGWEIEDYEDEVYAILETDEFEYLADIYLYGGVVSVDVYAYEVITEWPTEKIAEALEEQDLDVELPVFETEEGMRYSVNSEYDEEYEIGYVDITAVPDDEDSEITNLDYVELFDDASFSKEADEYGDYEIVPNDKSCVIYVYALTDDEYEVIPGFEVVVVPYVADYSIKASAESEFIVTSSTANVSVEKIGRDVPDDAKFTFASSDETVATVNENGVVSALKEGKVVITASYEDCSSSVTFFVRDVVADKFTDAQLEVFKNIHNVDGLAVPFNPHFTNVEWDDDYECVSITGDVVGSESALNYYNTLIEAGWVDLLAESGIYEYYQMIYEAFGMEITIEEIVESMLYEGISFEKEIKIDDSTTYWIDADLYLDVEDEEDYEGALCVDVYDSYLYSYSDAKLEAEAILADLELVSTAKLPDTAIPASHYYVGENEGSLDFCAYGSSAKLADVKTVLEANGFTLESKSDEYYGDYLEGISTDEVLAITVYEYEGDIEILIGANVSGVTIDFSEVKATSGTFGDFSFATSKASGQSDPAYNSNKAELRLYANNTITFTSEKTIQSIFFDANTCGESKATGSFVSASTGSVSAVDGGFLWEGSANEVTLTVSGSGQVHINSIDINGGGELLD